MPSSVDIWTKNPQSNDTTTHVTKAVAGVDIMIYQVESTLVGREKIFWFMRSDALEVYAEDLASDNLEEAKASALHVVESKLSESIRVLSHKLHAVQRIRRS